jgi:hypothetical protein
LQLPIYGIGKLLSLSGTNTNDIQDLRKNLKLTPDFFLKGQFLVQQEIAHRRNDNADDQSNGIVNLSAIIEQINYG